MSGDVQPRKRKDKKKKKDEPPPPFVYLKEEPQPPVVVSQQGTGTGSSSPDELIHIYKESRLGGNICAKVVFFLLLGTLTVMVGLIITEYRGSGEVETAVDSPWSKLLEGWIDNAPSEHDHHEVVDSGEDHDVDHREEDDNGHGEEHGEGEGDEDEEHEDNDQYTETRFTGNVESKNQVSDEEDEEDDISDHLKQQGDEEEGDEEGVGENEGDEEDKEKDEYEGNEEEDQENEDEGNEDDLNRVQSAEENHESEEENEKGDEQEPNNDDQDEDDQDNLNFLMHGIPGITESAEAADNDEADDNDETQDNKYNVNSDVGEQSDEAADDDILDDGDQEDDQSHEQFNDLSSEQALSDSVDKAGDDYEEFMVEREADVISAVPIERDEDGEEVGESDEFEEVGDAAEPATTEEDRGEGLEPTGVALKFGVGIAIIIVAHVVLVRKWNESDEAGATTLQPTAAPVAAAVPRRQTLIPPSTDPSSLLPEPDDMEEYSDEEEEGEEEDEEDEDYENEDDNEKDENPIRAKLVKEAFIRKYGKLSPEASEEEQEEEEEEDDDADDVEYDEDEEDPEQEFDKLFGYKYTAPSKRQQSEEGEEDELGEEEDEGEDYTRNVHRWKSAKDPEVSDTDDLSGSEGEIKPSVPPNRGPQEHDTSEWPIGPDYPPDQSSEPLYKNPSNFEAVEAQLSENPQLALKEVDNLLAMKPGNLHLLSFRAQALDRLAEIQHSNKFLEEAIASYSSILQTPEIDDDLYQITAERCINRMRFRGQHSQAIGIHKQLISRFPKEPKHRNDLAITYLMMGKIMLAKHLLEETLKIWPKDGIAMVHYGFILKTHENKNKEGARYMQAGIDTQENGTMDARFLFHLGDAYNRIGLAHKASEIYELGAKKGMFRSKYQRSLYNVDHLTARPWWSLQQTTFAHYLISFEDRWLDIRKEALSILHADKKGVFQDEAENLRDFGDWKQLELYARGHMIQSNCQKAPLTCHLISQFPAARSCRRGQAKFSIMHPGTHVWPHCGPTNCRLRSHLGLVVPSGTEIRVASEKRSWQEGKVIVFDDSFEHEVWHNGSSFRLVLIVDFWHPDLTEQEKRSLPSI